ncbi:MAG: sensor histidine kinase [Kineosporiaceae bacterium]
MLADPWLRIWAAPLLRAVLLVFTAVVGFVIYSALEQSGSTGDIDWTALDLVTVTAVLAVTGVLASLRPPRAAIAVAQPIVEATVVGVLIATVAYDLAVMYAGFLFVATFVSGQRSGLTGGLVAAAAGALPWGARVFAAADPASWDSVVAQGRESVPVLGALATVSLLSAWIRRLRLEREVNDDSAYASAFRLLSELQHVSRNLSLGLDPATLAAALVEDVAREAPGVATAVAVRGPEGRFAPLVGSLDDAGHSVASQAWLSGTAVTGSGDGAWRRGVPVAMGERVVAVAAMSGTRPDGERVGRVDEIVTGAAPRLAAALLFDEVRRLATNDERLRLAREIHDGIAQELASIGYVLDDLGGRVPAEAADDLRMLREHVRRVTGDLRLSIFDLRAGVDEAMTLGAAVAEQAQRVAAAGRVVAHTTIDEQGDRLSPGVEIELLRIAQEAMTNVRKHARASTVWIECTVDAPEALLRISDDGIGLQSVRPGAMGLQGMHERARRIGGQLDVRAREGGGTVVEVVLGRPAVPAAPLGSADDTGRVPGVARRESIA